MGDNQKSGDNLMDFADDDGEKTSDKGSRFSWISLLSELEQMPSTPGATASKPSSSTNMFSRPSQDELDSLQWVYPQNNCSSNGRSISNKNPFLPESQLFVNNFSTTSAQSYDAQTVASGSNIRLSHSEGNLSPTHSVSKRFDGLNISSDDNNYAQGSAVAQRSLTPPPLPVNSKKHTPIEQDSTSKFNDSPAFHNQFALRVNLDEPPKTDPTDKYLEHFSEMLQRADSIGSASDSFESSSSSHPFDSISLKRNFSMRSFQSNDSDVPSSGRSVLDKLASDVRAFDRQEVETEYGNPKNISSDPSLDYYSFANEQHQPLQVKLPDLETEEMEFFGRQSLEREMSVPPKAQREIKPHRYSVGDTHKLPTPTMPKAKDNLDVNKKAAIEGGLFEVAKERDLEVVAFGKMLSDLRSMFQYQDTSNRGFVLSPALPPSFGEEAYDLDTEIPVVIYTESERDTIRFSTNVHKPVRDVIELAISCLSEDVTDVTDHSICEAFLLKVCGKSEYLEAERELVDYECVQQCLKLQTEVRFVLTESDRVSRKLARSQEDDQFDLIPRTYKDFFDLTRATAISQYGLSVLMEAFQDEVAKVLQESTDLVAPRFEPSRIIQSVKAICAMLASIETSEIHGAVDELVQLQQRKEGKNGAPLPPDSDSINRLLTRLSESVQMLVEMYCEAFDTEFTARIYRPGLSGTFEVTAMTENLRIRIASAHRLPLNWKQDYEYFDVEAAIYYGGSLLCPVEIAPLMKITKKFLDHLRWDEWLEFNIQVRQLPRESRLCLTLYGFTSMTKGTAVHTPRVPLGWVGMQLFNFNGILASGTQLLGLWPDAKANPVGACTSNLLQPTSVLILLEFERYLAEIIFPECTVPHSNDELEIPEADYSIYEQILEKDLFNELKPDEKEVLWLHRYYCRTVSRALPLVLSTVTSWEYKYLQEIYRLLNVWTPMFPVDAMELLKVNFPDCKVRAMAVRWMGNFSDDELCDYLPQLVQALKYEIYHDSPLARFLVRRALGNVRLMHLLFWYLKDKINEPQFGQRFQVPYIYFLFRYIHYLSYNYTVFAF